MIGEATTKFDNQPNRNTNIKIAAGKVNEFVVNPGETFSFSKELGEVSKNTGYKPAGTFLNHKIVDSIGGGICQVTSTLYQALVKSDLKIVERNQHSMRVPYCTIGLDAMYYEGQSDLKFQNTFDFPIVIKSYVSNGELTFKIFGDTDKKIIILNYLHLMYLKYQCPSKKFKILVYLKAKELLLKRDSLVIEALLISKKKMRNQYY